MSGEARGSPQPAAGGVDAIREIVPPHTALAFASMRALRPALEDEAAFVHRVDEGSAPRATGWSGRSAASRRWPWRVFASRRA